MQVASERADGQEDGTGTSHRRLHRTGREHLGEETAQTLGSHRTCVPHREENSREEKAVVVLARSTQEGHRGDLASLRAGVPEPDRMIAQLSADRSD